MKKINLIILGFLLVLSNIPACSADYWSSSYEEETPKKETEYTQNYTPSWWENNQQNNDTQNNNSYRQEPKNSTDKKDYDYNPMRAGTPRGFYDDIDPNSLEDDDNYIQSDENKDITAEEKKKDEEPAVAEPVKAKPTKNYAQIYNELEIPTFGYLHDIDPDQYYDMKDTAWSIYPLLRLNSPIYFKSITIEPGYYLLTPREQDGKWFMLFKQNGVVKHIIPVFDRDYTPETFYDEHIPKPKLTPSQKIHMGALDFLGNFKSTKRKEPIKSYLEVNDVENYFVTIIIYYGGHKYSTIFRTIKL